MIDDVLYHIRIYDNKGHTGFVACVVDSASGEVYTDFYGETKQEVIERSCDEYPFYDQVTDCTEEATAAHNFYVTRVNGVFEVHNINKNTGLYIEQNKNSFVVFNAMDAAIFQGSSVEDCLSYLKSRR